MNRPSTHAFTPDLVGECQDCPLPREHPVHPPLLPETPYAGTSGWSGSQTSRERAEDDDATGRTTERQEKVLGLLRGAGERGMTWREVSDATGDHHGQASGALSVLHKAGRIAHLSGREERREKCSPYVLPDLVNGRETREQGRTAADPEVVKREEWRVVGMDRERGFDRASDCYEDRATAAAIRAHRGGSIQRRTVIETIWEDA